MRERVRAGWGEGMMGGGRGRGEVEEGEEGREPGGFEGFAIIHLTGTARISGQNPTPKFMTAHRQTEKKKLGTEETDKKREKTGDQRRPKMRYRKETGRKNS